MEKQSLCAHDCFDETVDRYGDLVYRLACTRVQTKTDADDVFQNVFLLYFQKNPTFETEEHRRNWLNKTMRFSVLERRVFPFAIFFPKFAYFGCKRRRVPV